MKSIKTRLILFITLLVLIPFLASNFFNYFNLKNRYETFVDGNVQVLSNALAQNIQSFIEKAYAVTETLALSDDIIYFDPDVQKRLLVDVFKKNSYFDLFYVQGMDGMQTARSSGNNGDRSSRWWFLQALRDRTPFVSKSYYSVSGNATATAVIYPVYNSNKKMVGIMGSDIKLDTIQTLVEGFNAGFGSYAYILDGTGTVVAHPNRDYVKELYNYTTLKKTALQYDVSGNAIKDEKGNLKTAVEDIKISDEMKEITEKVLLGESGQKKFTTIEGQSIISAYTPIKLPGISDNWAVISIQPEEQAMEMVNNIRDTTLIGGFILMIFVIAAVFLVSFSITKPIKQLTHSLKDISSGSGDLTKRLKIKGNDEFSEVAHYFNLTIEKIQMLILSIRNDVGDLNSVGVDLASNMTETAAAVVEITENISSVKKQILSQSERVDESFKSVDEMGTSNDSLNNNIENQAAVVIESSASIEEMISSIQSISIILNKNEISIQQLQTASENGKSGMEEVSTLIKTIADESQGILEASTVIQNIAAQTNLLAMNAAIEAAHAGDSGKGFAVVADEIRKLAENSSVQSKSIETVLNRLKNSIDKVLESSHNAEDQFVSLFNLTKVVNDQESIIKNAMDEQSTGGAQVLEGIKRVNDITSSVQESSHQMLSSRESVQENMEKLNRITEEITKSMDEMNTGAKEINVSVNMVNDISFKNRESIERLSGEVSKFTVDKE